MIIIISVTFTELKLHPYHTVYSYILKELNKVKLQQNYYNLGMGVSITFFKIVFSSRGHF